MADVQIQQTPGAGTSSGWIWAIVVLILVAVVAWFVFAGGRGDRTAGDTEGGAKVEASGSVSGSASGGATKTP